MSQRVVIPVKCGNRKNPNCPGHHATVAGVRECYGVPQTTPPTSAPASKLPKIHEAPGVEPLKIDDTPLKNRYGGKCRLCGVYVEAEAGHIEKIDGKWTVFHNEGECEKRYKHSGDPAWESADGDPEGFGDPIRYTEAGDPAVRSPSPATPSTGKADPRWDPIAAGFYATPSLTGNNDLDFWKVDRPKKGKWSGYIFVKRVIGGHDDKQLPSDSKRRISRKDTQKIQRVTQEAALQAILDQGPDESAFLFGKELKYCCECGIHLTDETSRALGIGPVCRTG
jgi:hypothetical protein